MTFKVASALATTINLPITNQFPALIGKFRRDVAYDKAVLRDWDFPFFHLLLTAIAAV